MKISEDEVRYVARLARLTLDDSHIQAMSENLSRILTYMDKLNEVETTDVPPTSHVVKMDPLLRPDEVRGSLPLEQALQNAPDRAGAFYRVPRILE
ncbi:Asp-tRNA(Asn)/Glu-tRNA(Gln) amidotransferase subunit GatC [candidate division KSB3 bacterium]|uniref:Aspartyl/glutamyl-tRNA(Asn/Gln) amidotransferase subunit C n=1 Tax=candidate division KSB3 bacterium TaxID=2044937 RepID=A0A9D5K050_9BACT|nr:Asp-tRNA(Asn)/Glu-tRNA(Gln) amidotransferase subunit GatC [candidate division KSB3 bacterium]MBD3327318.1 Asp-tRNA(Asn)/Glu-tRNA(Gln) amidotransferase subunit GatC [candidate division KSB3 bacterium]